MAFSTEDLSSIAAKIDRSLPLEELVSWVLEEFVRRGELPFAWKDVKWVCREVLGDGPALRDAERAFDRRVTKVDRGLYALRGGATPPRSASAAPQPARLLNIPASPRGQSKPSGVSWAPRVLSPDPGKESWYGEDAGLRRLAVAQSKCFGGWSDTDFACTSCPLARWCQEAALAKLDELARALDKEEEDRLSQAQPAQPAQVQPAQVQPAQVQPAQVAQVAQVAQNTATPSAAPPSPAQVQAQTQTWAQAQTPDSKDSDPLFGELGTEEVVRNLTAGGATASIVPMPFRGVCTGCEEEAPAGESMIYIRGKGMFHPECAKATL